MSDGPPDPDRANEEDAKAFAGGCLAGMGAVGLAVTTVVLVALGIVVIGVFLLFLACAGAFN